MKKHYQLKIPSRINILGNPADANEGDFAIISSAINIFAHAIIEPANQIHLSLYNSLNSNDLIHEENFPLGFINTNYGDDLALMKAAIKVLYEFSPEFKQKYNSSGFSMRFWTEVPRQSGLGGSSLFVLLLLGGMREFYELDPNIHNDYILSEIAQHAEADELGIACGFADRIVPLFGGICYTDYRGKVLPHSIGEEPMTTYERLDEWVDELPLVIASTGVQRDSGDVHGQMRPRYIEAWKKYLQTGGNYPPMVQFMANAYETAWRGKMALLRHDWKTFGDLMNQNHSFVNDMMNFCGFTDGAGWANNLMIHAALDNGALGAKLTGAGSGGSVFALTYPGEEYKLINVWEETAEANGLTNAVIRKVEIARKGLRIEEI